MDNKYIQPKARSFYKEVLTYLTETEIPYLVAGTFALTQYTEIQRPTKDLDLFCKAGDYPRLLKALADKGFKTEVTDERWIAKALLGKHFVDFIFAVVNGIWAVDDTWFENAPTAKVFDVTVKLVPPEEMIWSKIYRTSRGRSDIADVNHMILKQGKNMDWKRLLTRMEQHWEVLFSTLLIFRFVYPSERNLIPEWLIKELLSRVENQLVIPTPKDKACRGHVFSDTDYDIDFKKWGFLNINH